MIKKDKRGFSLIELFVVMAVMAILVLIATPKYLSYTIEARQKQIVADIKVVGDKVSTYLVKNALSDEDRIEVDLLKEQIASNKLYNLKGLVTSFDETDSYTILPAKLVKSEAGSKLNGQFISSSGGDVYYIDTKPGKSVPEAEQSAPTIKFTQSEDPDKLLATISYPAYSTVQEYKVDEGPWQQAIINNAKASLFQTIHANSLALTFEVNIPIKSTIYARASYKDIVKEASAIVTDGSIDISSSNNVVTIVYPADTETKLYRIDNSEWKIYTEPVALIKNGIIKAISKNVEGEITFYKEKEITYMPKVISIVAGGEHSLAIKSDGSLWAWGSNGSGRLGDGTGINKSTPVKVLDNVVSVAAGSSHSLAIKEDGSLWAWGQNTYGQLGDKTTSNKSTPVKILDNVVSVTAGSSHSLAIKEDGSLWAWGSNGSGSLGDGTGINKSTPVKVLDNVVSVAAGSSHSLAIKEDGSLWAWGQNNYGQLGDNTTSRKYTPVKVLDNVVSVAVGNDHSLAIKEDGNLWAWGYNLHGLLGDGAATNSLTPVKVLDNVAFVSAGSYHSFVIKEDDNLWAWGLNSNGQLGDKTTTHKSTPVKVLDSVVSVTAGANYSVAIKSDGSLWTWGRNNCGQLGDGTTVDKIFPIQIILP